MKATCTWGDCVDVSLTLDGTSLVLFHEPKNLERWMHGEVTGGHICLTSQQAKDLAGQLMMAALQADELEQQCKDHDDLEETVMSKKSLEKELTADAYL